MSQGKIHVSTRPGLELWTWRSGRGSVVIRDPDLRSYVVDHSTISGVPWDQIERSAWKGGSAHEITPAVVRKYIETVIKRGRHQKKGLHRFRRGPKEWSPRGVDPGRFRTK